MIDSRVKLAYSIEEAAAASGVSADTIRRAIHSTGEPDKRGRTLAPLVGAKRLGGKVLIPADRLAAWIAALPEA